MRSRGAGSVQRDQDVADIDAVSVLDRQFCHHAAFQGLNLLAVRIDLHGSLRDHGTGKTGEGGPGAEAAQRPEDNDEPGDNGWPGIGRSRHFRAL